MVASARSIVRFGRPPAFQRRHWRDPETLLPRPPVNITTREFAPCRLEDHYHSTLQSDLMYLTYKHELGPRQAPRQIRLKYDVDNPYSKYRKNPPVGGARLGQKLPEPSAPDNITRLESIQIHTMLKEAIGNKSSLLGVIMALRVLSGESRHPPGHHAVEGIQLVRGKKSVGGWIRPNVPVGAKVDLRGRSMYDFLGTLVEFVLPRLREFHGIPLPYQSDRIDTPSSIGGVVSFGLPAHAMSLFPQIEVNQETYPKMYGMHLHFITNATGLGAQDKARALLSGFGIPFLRR